MKNPLVSLDELIWKQFEKVTVAAEKGLGWDKWDLYNIIKTMETTLVVGASVYLTGYGLQSNNLEYGGIGVGGIMYGGIELYLRDKIIYRWCQDEAKKLLHPGKVLQSQFDARRPLLLAAAGYCLLMATLFEKYPQFLNVDPTDHIRTAISFLTGSCLVATASASYIRSQPTQPLLTPQPLP